MYRALVTAPEAWTEPVSKYKTPNDFVLSALRAMQFSPQRPQMTAGIFDLLGQRTYAPGSPAGWPDQQHHWDGSDALLKRVEWAIAIGERTGDLFDPMELAPAILGPSVPDYTMTAIARAESAGQGLALLFSSPNFQRR